MTIDIDRGSIMKASLGFCLAVILAAAPAAAAQNDTPASGQSASTTAATTQESPARPAKPKKHKTVKKHTGEKPTRSGAAIYKENGKTCSGLDQYKVCW
jgi:hypothetical protein